MSNRVIYFFRNPKLFVRYISSKHCLDWLPDKLYLKIMYYCFFNRKLNLKAPWRFSEKLQWLKLYDRQPIYTMMVDKYQVRQYVKEKIGDNVLPMIYGCWDRFEKIDFSKLPKEFVLKCTHDSGSVMKCEDKEKFDYKLAEKYYDNKLKRNYFWHSREWPYKNVTPRIIAEEYLKNDDGEEISAYKFFCFKGIPKIVSVVSNVNTPKQTVTFFDMEWKFLPVHIGFKTNCTIRKPEKFKYMIDLAKVLSMDIPFVRIDFNEVNNKVLFSEMTFFPSTGFAIFHPETIDKLLGKWLILPE